MEISKKFNQVEELAFIIREHCWDLINTEKDFIDPANPWPILIGGLAKVVENSFTLLDFEANGQMFLASGDLGKHYFYSGAKLEELHNDIFLLRNNILNLTAVNVNDFFVYVTISNRLNTAIDRLNMIAVEAYHKAHTTELRELGQKDRVTNLLNQQTLIKVLEYELFRAKRFRQPLSLLLLEIDNFNKVLKTGPLKANELLLEMARTIVKTLRAVDIAGRFLDQQFAILLPKTTTKEAKIVGERLRKAGRSVNPLITVSIGLASYPEKAKTKTELIKTAHLGLTLAKKQGNSVCIYTKNVASA